MKPEATKTVITGVPALAMDFHYAAGGYPLMAQASFASAKGEFEKVRVAKAGLARPSQKPTVAASGPSGRTGAMAGRAAGAGVGLVVQQNQINPTVGNHFANQIPPQGVPGFPLQSSVVGLLPHPSLPLIPP